MPPAWTIIEYAGRDGLMQLEPDWTRLVAAMPDAGYQHLFETHLAYCDCLPSAHGPMTCLALSDGERVRAICPVEPQPFSVFRSNTVVWGLPRGLGDIPRDVICPPDSQAEAVLLPHVTEHLRRASPRGRWFVLARVLEGSAAWRCLPGLDAGRYHADRDDSAHIMHCDQAFAGLTSRLSRKFRANLRSANNRLAVLPDVHFMRTADAADINAAFERFLKVEASGWKGEGGSRTAIALQPKQDKFYRAWVALLRASGRCEFNELRSGNTCLASVFCVRANGEYGVMKMGYDERFAGVAPGHMVFQRIFRECCEDPSIKRASLISSAAWNLVWEPEDVGSYNVFIGTGGLVARARVGLLRMSFKYWPTVKRWLQRSGFGDRVARRLARQ